MSITWKEPPPAKGSGDLATVAEQVKARPGQWAYLGRRSTGTGTQLKNRYRLEVTGRNYRDGYADTYVRWNPEGEFTPPPSPSTTTHDERRDATVDFLREYIYENRIAPSVQEMADHFGVTPQAIRYRLKRLEKDGRIRQHPNAASRAVRIVLLDD